MSVEDWNIDRPLGQCTATGRKIQTGEEYFAALVETEEGLKRRDFCVDYWTQSKPDVYCYWKTKLPAEITKRRIFVDDQILMTFFERLAGETEPAKLNFRFVLALVLMRRKKLKYDSSLVRDECEIWRLRVTGSDQYVEVSDPKLDAEQIEHLSGQIGQILQSEL